MTRTNPLFTSILLFSLRFWLAGSRPVIGVFTLPCDKYSCPTVYEKRNYIAASYVKWLESGGAQVIPIFHNSTKADLEQLIPHLNGVLFTGGAVKFESTEPWIVAMDHTLDILRQISVASKGKNVIPLWSTCLGFEALITQVAKAGFNIRGEYDAEGLDLPVEIVSNSRFFDPTISRTASIVSHLIETTNTTVHFHMHGISPHDFQNDPYIHSNFTLVGVSYDRNHSAFVSMIASKPELNLAWYGTQYHPEKPQYEWGRDQITHTHDAIIVNSYLASFFVSECESRNTISMDTKLLNEKVIYNYKTTYEGQPGAKHAFTEVYMF